MAHLQQETVTHGHRGGHLIDVTAHVSGHATQTFEIGAESTLLEVMERAAELAGFALLPPGKKPFDQLHAMSGEHVGAVIEHLDQSLAKYLRHADNSPHFTVELVRAIHVNNRWDVRLAKTGKWQSSVMVNTKNSSVF